MTRKALDIDTAYYGDDNPIVATDLNNLGVLLMKMGRYNDSEPNLRKALAIRDRSLPIHHPEIEISLESLRDLAELRDDFREFKMMQDRLDEILASREE